jgi:hypothetical protein
MGTSYTIYKNDKIEFSIDEMSNKLELVAFDNDGVDDCSAFFAISTPQLEPAEMLQCFMLGIKAISYWMSKEEFDAVFSKLEIYPY